MSVCFKRILLTAIGLTILGGCSGYGPTTITRDQMGYGRSVGDSWKNQMLSNLVKLRFVDMPVFVDVGQIVSGYSIETAINGSVGFSSSVIGNDTQSIGAGGKFTDRPTITYVPKTGQDFLRSMLVPVNPSSLLSLVQAGYSPKLLFGWGVESINGVRNYSNKGSGTKTADPEFIEFINLLSDLQGAGAIGLEIEKNPETKHESVFFFPNSNLNEEVKGKRERARKLIRLKQGQQRFRVLYSPFANDDDVLAIQTRSILQILSSMAGFVDVPADKVHRAQPGHSFSENESRPFRVRTSTEQPIDPFASFLYHGDWYWIDHEDLASKRVFLLMLFLTTLSDSGENQKAPVLTIPTS
jgi:hypothetical protein